MTWPRGKDCKLYYGAASAEIGAMTVLGKAQEVTVNLEKEEADNTAREDVFRSRRGTFKTLTIDFKMRQEPEDPGVAAIRNAYLNETTLELAALTGLSSDENAEGPKGTFDILKMTRNEPLEGGVTYDCTATLVTFDEWIAPDLS
ncbi:MAG: hypothetical protein MUP47_02205 [Phycisphaerae bacterium]|nr:hypothetical protein [Phycisphaerae bacterium]